ncbi:MAG: LPS export ABC transporter periplasmic protein LptC [Prevotella sp.]|nr:LPS export ABC transporter periplasmic protein LptC [Prevotella sp.]
MRTIIVAASVVLSAVNVACTEQQEHTAPAVRDEDSAAMMTSYGINMLISDSGVMKYRIVAERSIVNQNLNPKRQTYDKGVFMTQFDESFHVESYIQADTAYKYDELNLIELRGRVRVLTKNGVKFRGEELFWDQRRHEYYSNMYSYMETPERTLEGNYFRSDEAMEKYYVSNSKGSFERRDITGDEEERGDTDSIAGAIRPPARPRAKRH